MLEAAHLTKIYAGIPAVESVSFRIAPGEILGYLGPNGSGKSTTVKMLTGLLQPTCGEIRLDGRPLAQDPTAYKLRLGYVPEEPQLYSFLSAGVSATDRAAARAGATGTGSEDRRPAGAIRPFDGTFLCDRVVLQGDVTNRSKGTVVMKKTRPTPSTSTPNARRINNTCNAGLPKASIT